MKFIRKMKKLLAMSQDASSEKEAETALRQLHFLLAKHNVSMDELDDKEKTSSNSTDEVNWPWKRTVAHAVAKLYFCKFYFISTRKNYATYVIVGTESNRLFASAILKNVFRTVEHEAKRQDDGTRGFVASFRNGMAHRVYIRCIELRESACSGSLESTEGDLLPAMYNVYERFDIQSDDFMESTGILTVKSKSFTRADNLSGMNAGYEEGGKVQLSRALQTKTSPKLLER